MRKTIHLLIVILILISFFTPLKSQTSDTINLENAFKFTEKGQIEIGYTDMNPFPDKKFITFFVKDTGIGLSIEQKKIIFNRFRKVEDNRKKLYRGAGLGLAICKNLTDLLGGELWLESEKDQGSTFYFTLPFSKLAQKENNNIDT